MCLTLQRNITALEPKPKISLWFLHNGHPLSGMTQNLTISEGAVTLSNCTVPKQAFSLKPRYLATVNSHITVEEVWLSMVQLVTRVNKRCYIYNAHKTVIMCKCTLTAPGRCPFYTIWGWWGAPWPDRIVHIHIHLLHVHPCGWKSISRSSPALQELVHMTICLPVPPPPISLLLSKCPWSALWTPLTPN